MAFEIVPRHLARVRRGNYTIVIVLTAEDCAIVLSGRRLSRHELDAGYFPSRRPPTRTISLKDEIGFVLTQGTKIVNLRRDSARRP
jgi:hypothetical protein